MNKRFLAFFIAAVVVFIGLVIINRQDDPAVDDAARAAATNHVFGVGAAGVTVVEYLDFQCPACANYYPIVKLLKQEYGDRVFFQVRHFPLIQIHQNAMAAHRAAEAAGLQGKFWEMHDLLLENQTAWANSTNPVQFFEDYAGRLGLDMERFRADMVSAPVGDSIQADMRAGQELGVNRTPTFVIDGQVIESPQSIEAFRAVIDQAIAARAGQ